MFYFFNFFKTFSSLQLRIVDFVEIFIIFVLIYYFLKFIIHTKSFLVFKGLFIISIFAYIAYIFDMKIIMYICKNCFNIFIIIIILMFNQEIRELIEKIGNKYNIFSFNNKYNYYEKYIKELCEACEYMSNNKIGALIVLKKNINLLDYEKTGVAIDAKISKELLINIFMQNTPLHDGAVIIKNNRISTAGCILNLTKKNIDDINIGTRHMAAIGISEKTDAFVIVVSEESGDISIVRNGVLDNCNNIKQLYKILCSNFNK